MASRYFAEIAQKYPGRISRKTTELSNQYHGLAKLLERARDQKLGDKEKVKTLQEAQRVEEFCIQEIEKFLNIHTGVIDQDDHSH